MKKLFIFLFCLGSLACNGQKGNPKKDYITSHSDTTLSKPRVDIKVNKKYDARGNLISFDSTYSYFYLSPQGKRSMNNDSLFQRFKLFNQEYFNKMQEKFNNTFLNDSLFKYDFFNPDYFRKRFELNMKRFDQEFKTMDSLKNNYLKHVYPQGTEMKK